MISLRCYSHPSRPFPFNPRIWMSLKTISIPMPLAIVPMLHRRSRSVNGVTKPFSVKNSFFFSLSSPAETSIRLSYIGLNWNYPTKKNEKAKIRRRRDELRAKVYELKEMAETIKFDRLHKIRKKISKLKQMAKSIPFDRLYELSEIARDILIEQVDWKLIGTKMRSEGGFKYFDEHCLKRMWIHRCQFGMGNIWTNEEDQLLDQLVEQLGYGQWTTIAEEEIFQVRWTSSTRDMQSVRSLRERRNQPTCVHNATCRDTTEFIPTGKCCFWRGTIELFSRVLDLCPKQRKIVSCRSTSNVVVHRKTIVSPCRMLPINSVIVRYGRSLMLGPTSVPMCNEAHSQLKKINGFYRRHRDKLWFLGRSWRRVTFPIDRLFNVGNDIIDCSERRERKRREKHRSER